MRIAAQKVRVKAREKAVATASASSSHAAPARVATGMATVQNAAPEKGRLTTSATKQHVTMAPAQIVRVQIARQQAPARTAHAPTASALIARSVRLALVPILALIQAQHALSIAVRTDRVLNVHTLSVQTAIVPTLAKHTPVIVPITLASRRVIVALTGAASVKAAASKIGTASARPSS